MLEKIPKIKKCRAFYKAVGPGKNAKFITVGPSSIPDSRVGKSFIINYLSFVGYPLSSHLVRKVAPPSFLHFVGGRKSNSASSTGPPLTPEN